MDPATLIGLVIAFGSLYAMIVLEGAHVSAILLPAPMILVFGATIAIGIASYTVRDSIAAFKAVLPAVLGKPAKVGESIKDLVRYAEVARSKGLLALEEASAEARTEFERKALQNVADGTDPEELRVMLEDEIESRHERGRTNAKFFAALGGFAPTVGIIGTVVSLTHVLENLSSPENLGPMIATAFVATLWGLLSANFIWLPISARIERMNELESKAMTVRMEGILAVQNGIQPLLLGERLTALAGDAAADGKPRERESVPLSRLSDAA
ncbi:MAG: MotA/TolQ/ExbB proton channel family protein [Arthrobacter sp.]